MQFLQYVVWQVDQLSEVVAKRKRYICVTFTEGDTPRFGTQYSGGI